MEEKRSFDETFQKEKVKTTNKILVLCLLTKSNVCLSVCVGGRVTDSTADWPSNSVAPCCARQRHTLDPPLQKVFTRRPWV